MFSTLDKPASMKEMMSILSGARALSKKLNGCTNMCVVGATAGLNVCSDSTPISVIIRRLERLSA
jgi:hypothetical protein